MGRLTGLKPRIGAMAQRLGHAPLTEQDRSRQRDASHAWRRWYKTARWQKLRWSILVRDLFTCARCKRIEGETRMLVCDHVEPHRGDEGKFWAGPFQTLCKTCHDVDKQREERGRAGQAGR